MEEFSIINPYTLKCVKKYTFEPISSCEKKIDQLHDSFLNWRTTSVQVKEEWLNELAKNLTENQHNISSIISSDMGKPIRESEREVQKCIQCCQFYADNAALIHSKLTKNNGYRSPVGRDGNHALEFSTMATNSVFSSELVAIVENSRA